MNFSDMDSKPPIGRIKQGIFALVQKDIIFIVSVLSTYHTLWKVLFLFLHRQGEN